MRLKKIEKKYIEEFGDIPRDNSERLKYLLYQYDIKPKHITSIFKRMNEIDELKWKTIRFIIYLDPKSTPRAKSRNTPKGPIFYVKGASINKEIFKNFFDKTNLPMITTPCKLTVNNYLDMPNSLNKVNKVLAELGYIRPLNYPDWDNLGKTYSDMIQDTLLFNDDLIIEGTSKKFYSIKPRVEITIEYLLGYDCEYNEKKLYRRLNK